MNNSAFEKFLETVRAYRYHTFENQKKELFGVRTKLSYNKIVFRKLVRNRNEQTKNTKILMNKSVRS